MGVSVIGFAQVVDLFQRPYFSSSHVSLVVVDSFLNASDLIYWLLE